MSAGPEISGSHLRGMSSGAFGSDAGHRAPHARPGGSAFRSGSLHLSRCCGAGEPSIAPSAWDHVVGTKYVDYFTDGTKTYSFPGDPKVDGNLNRPNAPIPTHGNLKWVSTSGMEDYDTPSGDLEVGDYAQEADGSYITNVPAYTYTDATSSVPIAAHIATSKTDPTAPTSQ